MAKKSLIRTIAVGAAIAGAAGYVAGVLSAPSKGKKTRKHLKKAANNSLSDFEKQLKTLHTELGDLMHDAKGQKDDLSDRAQKKLDGAVDSAHGAKDKLRSVLSSLHEGEATDADLKRAFEDAKRSLEHLKTFIKK